MKKFKLIETDAVKILRSEKANYNFCKKTGYTELWGSSKEEEILFSEIGPFILDIEVTTICNHFCKFCYKNNTKNGTNMSYQTFTKIFDNMSIDCFEVILESGEKIYVSDLELLNEIKK